jgi:magnesium transporter
MGRTRLYRNGELVVRGFPADDVAHHLKDPSAVVWSGLRAPSQDEIGLLRDEPGLRRLVAT